MRYSLKKVLVYLPTDLISKLFIGAINHNQLRYSSLIDSWVSEGIMGISAFKDYSELKNNKKYSAVFQCFSPSKRGRPWNKISVTKKSITIYFSITTLNNITKFSKMFGLSKSSFVELALLIADKELNIGLPSFKYRDIKLYESDYDLLIKAMSQSGAQSVSEFLSACQFPFVLKEIKQEIGRIRQLG